MPEPVQPEIAQAAAQAIVQQPVVAPAPAVTESTPVVAQPAQAVVAPALPPAASDRTKEQFDKLLDSNQRLYEANEFLRREVERKAQATQTFQPVQQVQPVKPQQMPTAQDFTIVDPNTGEQFVDTNKLNAAIQDMTQRTSRAEQVVNNYIQTSEQREVERQNKEAFAAHPELDPKNPRFDAQLSDFTRAVIYDSLINEYRYGGKPLNFKDAADLVKSRMGSGQAQAMVQPEPQPVVAPASTEAKEQGSLVATGASQPEVVREQQSVDVEELRSLTRAGDDRALALRLSKIDHTRSASEDDA